MIETEYYILDEEQYQEFYTEAQQVGVTLDYYLDEFTIIEGPMCECVEGEWIESE